MPVFKKQPIKKSYGEPPAPATDSAGVVELVAEPLPRPEPPQLEDNIADDIEDDEEHTPEPAPKQVTVETAPSRPQPLPKSQPIDIPAPKQRFRLFKESVLIRK